MPRVRVQQSSRQFGENGLKLLLQEPRDLRDLLALLRIDFLDRLDFDGMFVDNTTYVSSDYRHVASDLVIRLPFRLGPQGGQPQILTLYILIEHQSEPDSLMLLRVLDYVVQIWKGQVRAVCGRRRPREDFRLQPILPIVLYTGTRDWKKLGRLYDLVEGNEHFRELIPEYQPLFLPLPDLTPAQLESEGGFLGWVLELLQQRHARPEEFRNAVRRVVEHLEEMPRRERLRWLELLSYIHELVYNVREEPEPAELEEVILASVQTDERRREVAAMMRSYAEVLEERGEKRGAVKALQAALVRQLRGKFGRVPKRMQQVIKATDDTAKLDAWLDQVINASTLEDLGIGSDA